MLLLQDPYLAPFIYGGLPMQTSFRVAELLPGKETDPVACLLHPINWSDVFQPEYEAISYAWGDVSDKVPIVCHGKELKVTPNLQSALLHFRMPDKSRFIWADALCIDQSDIPERSSQVKQMRKIYENAKSVLIWLGPDSSDDDAKLAIESLHTISDFLCKKLEVSPIGLSAKSNVYQEVIFKNRGLLPLPNECDFVTESMWNSLRWFFSHPYFTRVWVIQEINANQLRSVHSGNHSIEWDRVELVAGYIIMEPSFTTTYGFTKAKCWWAATITTERLRQPQNWLFMLYLASNFSSTDPRDVIYGLRGLMKFSQGAEFLDPDYNKSATEVYGDSVAAALTNFETTDVLLYAPGTEKPSWIPRWNQSMLFRNPFRFGRPLPWTPSKASKPIWNINQESNVLSLSGFTIDTIKLTEPYNERYFSSAMTTPVEGIRLLGQEWQRILQTIQKRQSAVSIPVTTLTAMATALSFGLDEESDPGDERKLMHNFVAYLRMVLDDEAFAQFIPIDAAEETKKTDGNAFGKPVWDFKYPDSSIFVSEEGLIGCCISTTQPGDVICVPFGSTYPFVLRPDGDDYLTRGFGFVHGIMHGERWSSQEEVFRIC
ncbi:hypothetical protein G7046_g8990 [Stylonectria norvegica]|nr:hypothetical protein G7046_g8990 [Stylonectria norvegica]